MTNFLHSLKYIYWEKEAKKITVTQEEFAEIFKKVSANGNHIKTSKCIRMEYNAGDYRYEKQGIHRKLYVFVKNGDYRIYSTNAMDDNKNGFERVTGPKAISAFMDKYKDLKKTNSLGFSKAFGTVDETFKNCVPRSFYYQDINKLDRVIQNACSIDAGSHYPASMKGRLPNARTAVRVEGRAYPNEEYPFAFYPESGHSAEYKVYNTMSWNATDFGFCFTFKRVKETYTILMKASEETLNDVWDYFYDRRKEDETAKAVMNCTIGMMHTKKYTSYRYAHLAAVAIARANSKHIEKASQIGLKNIIQICVDGIIYKGEKSYGEYTKTFGGYSQEFTGATIKVKGMNCYVVKDNYGKVIKVRHGAYNFNKDGTPIDETKITDFKDMDAWVRINPIEEVDTCQEEEQD